MKSRRSSKSTKNFFSFSHIKFYYHFGIERLHKIYLKLIKIIEKRPLLSFLSVLALLFIVIIIGNILRKPQVETAKKTPKKMVNIYRIGSVPKISLQGQIEKSGVIQIMSLMGGIVQNIAVYEGMTVYKGQNLISLSTNYQGGNSLSLTRQIAQVQSQNIENTYSSQKDIISKQRNLANISRDNTEQLRLISDQSKNDTQTISDFNNNLLDNLNDQLNLLSSDSSDPVVKSQIFSLMQAKSQLLSANLQINSGLRGLEYQVNTDKPPTKLADLQKDIAIAQLDLQEKALDLSREISRLQTSLSLITESTMFPSAPYDGTIERVYVRVGQSIGSNIPLFTLSAVSDPPLKIYIYTSKDIAWKVSKTEPTVFHLDDQELKLIPTYITTEAVKNNLYAVIYDIPQNLYSEVTDKGFLLADVPLGYPDTNSAFPFLPIDAIYQTQDKAFVFVENQEIAKAKNITLGTVYGNYVAIRGGLHSGDKVILDRNVIEGDPVKSNN